MSKPVTIPNSTKTCENVQCVLC